MLTDVNKIHFVGIGGIGMSGLAGILIELGYKVSGSDISLNSCTQRLILKGAVIKSGHHKDNLGSDVDMLVYSSSISSDNPELIKARAKNISVVHRADILAWLMQSRIGISVAGAHGKTTTTALIAHLLSVAGYDPTAVIGGVVNDWNTNARLGRGNYLVAEADESDGSFLKLPSVYTVVNNIDEEHLDYYKNINNIIEVYRCFVNNTRYFGCVFYCLDNFYLREIMKNSGLRNISYGLSEEANVYPKGIKLRDNFSDFECVYFGNNLGKVSLQIPGIHNILNACAALAVAKELNVDLGIIKEALFSYKGTKRRFQIKKDKPIMVVDDYAHHPAEIKATLEAACAWKKNRIIVVFQPHRYTRTFYLQDLFSGAFNLADKLIITDIYAAGEKPIEGISGEGIYDKVLKSGHKDAVYLNKNDVIPHLLKMAKEDDLILILGAGDVTRLSDELVDELNKKYEDVSNALV